MNTASKQTLHTIEQIVKPISIGTNLGLLQLIWAMITGAFLQSRGAVHTALGIAGFDDDEINRSWHALRYGTWHIQEMIDLFYKMVLQDGNWKPNEYGGYRPIAVDLTAIWRPRIQSWIFKLYRQLTGKAFKGIGFGLVVRVGHIDGHRIPILGRIVNSISTDKNEENLKHQSLEAANEMAEENEVIIHDGGAEISDMHAVDVDRYVIRLAANCTGRENVRPPYKGRGPYPSKGKLVRPLERTFKGKTHAATPEDHQIEFEFDGVTVVARAWFDLVRADLKVSKENKLFTIWVIDDPRYEGVLVLGTDLPKETHPRVVYQLFRDRWPVEQIPLVAKQLLGCHRQFVFHPTSCLRLGQLAFLAGNLLTWLALILPAFPTGYWDRRPKKTPGRLRRELAKSKYSKEFLSEPRIRKKNSVTAHLPKGILAHRRSKDG